MKYIIRHIDNIAVAYSEEEFETRKDAAIEFISYEIDHSQTILLLKVDQDYSCGMDDIEEFEYEVLKKK